MAVTFKTLPVPGGAKPGLTPVPIASQLRTFLLKAGFDIPKSATISVGATTCHVSMENGACLSLPFGTAHIVNGAGTVSATLSQVRTLMGVSAPPPAGDYENVFPADVPWIDALCTELFPITLPLCKAEKLYQPVTGTSSTSVYRVAFIGPNLRGACRIMASSISFRFTTPSNTAPTGDLRRVLLALGVNKVASDRITTHAAFTGPYAEVPEEYHMLFGGYYAALRPYITSGFPAVEPFMQNVA